MASCFHSMLLHPLSSLLGDRIYRRLVPILSNRVGMHSSVIGILRRDIIAGNELRGLLLSENCSCLVVGSRSRAIYSCGALRAQVVLSRHEVTGLSRLYGLRMLHDDWLTGVLRNVSSRDRPL